MSSDSRRREIIEIRCSTLALSSPRQPPDGTATRAVLRARVGPIPDPGSALAAFAVCSAWALKFKRDAARCASSSRCSAALRRARSNRVGPIVLWQPKTNERVRPAHEAYARVISTLYACPALQGCSPWMILRAWRAPGVGIVAGARLTLPCFQFRRLRLLCLQSCLLHSRPATLGGIFLAIDRRDMRGVSIEIRAPDPKLLLVRIDPLPQLFA